MKKLIYIVLLCLLPSLAAAANHFVSPSGAGASDCALVTTSCTVAQINAHALEAGDVVIIKSESTYTTMLTIASASGAGITVRGSVAGDGNWGDGTKTTVVSKPLFNGDVIPNPVAITNTSISSLTVKDIQVVGTDAFDGSFNYNHNVFYGFSGLVLWGFDANGRAQTGTSKRPDGGVRLDNAGVSVTGVVEVKNCTITGYGPATLPTAGVTDSGCLYIFINAGETSPTSLLIHDNTIGEANGDAFIFEGFKGTSWENSVRIYNNTFYNGGENNIDMKGTEYAYVYNNTFSRNYGWGGSSGSTRTEGLILVHDPDSFHSGPVFIYENFFNGNKHNSNGDYGPGVWVAHSLVQNVRVYNNYFLDTYPAIWVTGGTDGTEIYGNIIRQSTNPTTIANEANIYSAGIYVHGGLGVVSGVKIYNNSLYVGATNIVGGIRLHALSTTDIRIKNNAVHMMGTNNYSLYIDSACAVQPTSGGAGNIDYNIYFNGTDTERVWNRTAGANTYGTNDQSADPEFVDPGNSDFTLTDVDSPGVDEAFDLGGVDYDLGWSPATSLPPVAVTTLNRDTYGWDIGAYVFTPAAAPPPVISGVGIDTDGVTITITFNVAVDKGAGYSDDDFNVDVVGGDSDIAVVYVSGDGGAEWVYTIQATILATNTVNLDFDGALGGGDGDDIEEIGNADLVDIADVYVSNGSQVGASSAGVTITGTGNVTIE